MKTGYADVEFWLHKGAWSFCCRIESSLISLKKGFAYRWRVEAWRTLKVKVTPPRKVATFGEAMRLARRKADEMELELRGMDRAMRSTRRTA